MRLRFLILLFLVTISSIGLAQTNDFGVWTSVDAEKQLGKWDFAGDMELRTKENVSTIDRWSVGLTGGYQLLKQVKIGCGYDFIYFHDTKYLDYQPRHRANVFIQGKLKSGNFTFTLRERVQLTAKDVSDRVKDNSNIDNYKVNPEYTWRNKLNINYNIPKFPINPGLSVETFYTLNNPDGNTFEQIRYTLSFNYKLSKHHKFEVYGMYNEEINVEDPVQNFVLGIGYLFSF